MKNRFLDAAIGLALLAFIAVAKLSAAEMMQFACPHCSCPTGCCYKEVISHSCKMEQKMVPIKHTCYECKEIPYCEHMPPSLHDCCCCPQCKDCPKYKRVLIKKEVTCGEKCETKCVPVEHREWVLVPCCQCGYQPTGSEPSCGPCQAAIGKPGIPQQQYVQLAKPQSRMALASPVANTPVRSDIKVPEVVVADPFQVK